jgi:hypothetical protein
MKNWIDREVGFMKNEKSFTNALYPRSWLGGAGEEERERERGMIASFCICSF